MRCKGLGRVKKQIKTRNRNAKEVKFALLFDSERRNEETKPPHA